MPQKVKSLALKEAMGKTVKDIKIVTARAPAVPPYPLMVNVGTEGR